MSSKPPTVDVEPSPSPEGEAEDFENLDEARKRIENDGLRHDLEAKKKFVTSARNIAYAWIGFLILISICQFCFKKYGFGLSENSFIAVVVSASVPILGMWWQVGRSLYPAKKDK